MKENMAVLDISKQKKNDKSDSTSFFAHSAQDKSQTELELSPLDHINHHRQLFSVQIILFRKLSLGWPK